MTRGLDVSLIEGGISPAQEIPYSMAQAGLLWP